MKTRILFASMVLPTLFAACTSEELVDSQNVSTGLEGRALLNPITITLEGGVPETRFSWNEGKYEWNQFTADDKFSAGLIDNVSGNIGNDVQTNYIYSSTDGKSFTTTSQMVEGAYMFYSYTGFETSASRGPIKFDLTGQTKIDLNNPTATVEENKFFVAPLYNLEAETANNSLGLQFVSYWSTAAIKIANDSKQSFKIVRIILADNDANFAVKGTLDMGKLEDAGLIYAYSEDEDKYVLGKNTADKQAVYDDIRTLDIASDDAQKENELVVDCQSYELEAGKDVTAYIQVPAGLYDGLNVKVVAEVVDDKNVVSLKELSEVVNLNYDSNNDGVSDKTRFSRGKTTAVFGTENDAPAALEINDLDLLLADEAKGLYADSYDDMYEYVTEATNATTKDVKVYNLGSLKMDDQLMVLINSVATKGVKVEFMNPIEITSEANKTMDVTATIFSGGATLVKGSVKFGSGAVLPDDQTLTVSEGTTAIFADDDITTAGTIVNNGTIQNDLGAAKLPTIKNGDKSTLIINYNKTNIDKFNFGSNKYPSTIVVNKDITLTAAATGATVPYTTTIENNGTLGDNNKYIIVNGIVNNNGTIAGIKIQNPVDDSSNNLTDDSGNDIQAVINNYGKIGEVEFEAVQATKYGLIVMKNANASITTATGAGNIDNTINGFITTATNANVYAVYEGNQSGALANSTCKTVKIKNGTWTNPALPASVTTLEADKVNLVSTAEGKAINLASVTDLTLTGSTVDGNLTVGTGTNVTALKLDGSTFNGTLTVNSSLTELNLVGVTFNGVVTANDITTININATSDNKAATTTINATVTTANETAITVAAKATLDVTANGVIGNDDGTSNNTVTVDKDGTVNNRGIIYGNTTVSGTGSWNGPEPK